MGYKKSTPKDGLEGFQILPDSVLYDVELPGEAVRVYCYLSGHRIRNGAEVGEVGFRRMAGQLGISPKTVGRSLVRLEARGHIFVDRSLSRHSYVLRSSRFQDGDSKYEVGDT